MARKSIKRENGTGSVYKRKDLKRRPWVAVAPAELIRDDDARKVNAKQMIIGHYATAQEAKDALLRGHIDKAKYDELLSKALGRKDEPEEKSFAEQQIANNAFGLKDIAKEHGTATENS